MQALEISRKPRRVAKPKNEWEHLPLRLRPGTLARIAVVLADDEPDRTTFIRAAVERELARREAVKADE